MIYGYIYKTTNLINHKIYIGQKKSKLFIKNYFGSGKKIKLAINKYGPSNFKVELIEFCKSKDELDLREKFWIKEFNSRDLSIGYNIALGGNLGGFNLGYKLSNLHKLHISLSLKGRTVSEETKKKISNSEKGKHLSEETKKKISESVKLTMKNPEIREKCRLGGFSTKGKKHGPLSEESRKKISEGTKLGMARAKLKRMENSYE